MQIQWTLQNLLLAVFVVFALLAFLFGILALASNGKLNRRFKKWKSIHTTADLDKVYEETLQEVTSLKNQIERLEAEIGHLRNDLSTKISTAKILRYNAFSDTGSDLSYSVALLDSNKNGVVLSSIYGRDESRTYGKPVDDGKSKYPLTKEELQIIED